MEKAHCPGGDKSASGRRRQRCKIDDQVRYRAEWRLTLGMLDEAISDWGLSARPVVADAGYGGSTEFRRALTKRGLSYVVAVKASTSVHPGEAEITTALRPKSPCVGLTLYAVIRRFQTLLAVWTGACHTCHHPLPDSWKRLHQQRLHA